MKLFKNTSDEVLETDLDVARAYEMMRKEGLILQGVAAGTGILIFIWLFGIEAFLWILPMFGGLGVVVLIIFLARKIF